MERQQNTRAFNNVGAYSLLALVLLYFFSPLAFTTAASFLLGESNVPMAFYSAFEPVAYISERVPAYDAFLDWQYDHFYSAFITCER